jgi:tRNA-modifying protein YgfZ
VSGLRNYGDPAAEYDAARNAAALVERHDRVFLRAWGRDPVRMVQGLVSNDVALATLQQAVYATVLTPKGRMIADVRILRRGEELLLDVHRDAAEALMAHLKKFVPPLFARFEPADLAMHTVLGPDAARVLKDGFAMNIENAAPPESVWAANVDEQHVVAVATSHADVTGFDIITGSGAGATVWQRLTAAGARPAGDATLEVLRIEAGTPQWGAELNDTVIPLEAGLRRRAISETKGCYTGQEVIIRILHRGHVNWLLRGVLLGDAPTPARGAELHNAEGKKLGRVTSAAWSPRSGQTIALAYVRREVEPGSELLLNGGTAQIVELPFA